MQMRSLPYRLSAKELRAARLSSKGKLFSSEMLPNGFERSTSENTEDTVETELTRLVEEPFDSIGDTSTRLAELERVLIDQNDRRSVFATVYTQMTKKAQERINNEDFYNSEWMKEYLTTFANHYREAFLQFERGNFDAVPDCWKLAFRGSLSGYTLVIQDALLGINAHINYDLAFTLHSVAIDPHRPEKLEDHTAVNDTLKELVDVVQSVLVDTYHSSGLSQLDTSFGRLDESFSLLSLTEGRRLAWKNAVLLTDYDYRVIRSLVRRRLRAVSTGAGYFILSPSMNRSLLWILREIEGTDPPIKDITTQIRQRLKKSGE